MSIKHRLGINIYSSISISRGFSLNGGAFTENKGRKDEVTGTKNIEKSEMNELAFSVSP